MGSLSLSMGRLLCGREIRKTQDTEWLRKLAMHLEVYKKVLVLTFFLCTFEKTLTSSFDVSESSCSVRYIMMWGVFRIFCWIPSTSSPHRSLTRSLVFDCAFFCLGWVVSFFIAYAFSNVSFTFKKLKYINFITRENQQWFSQRRLYMHIHSSMHKNHCRVWAPWWQELCILFIFVSAAPRTMAGMYYYKHLLSKNV